MTENLQSVKFCLILTDRIKSVNLWYHTIEIYHTTNCLRFRMVPASMLASCFITKNYPGNSPGGCLFERISVNSFLILISVLVGVTSGGTFCVLSPTFVINVGDYYFGVVFLLLFRELSLRHLSDISPTLVLWLYSQHLKHPSQLRESVVSLFSSGHGLLCI